MRRFLHWNIILCLTSTPLLLVSCDSSTDIHSIVIDHPPIIEQALLDAKNKPKGVIIIFGADWCPPCRELDKVFEQIEVKSILQALYVSVKIDVGHWDKNMDIAKKYGNPIRKGIPGLVLLNQNGSIRNIIETAELSGLIKYGQDELLMYLQEN